MLRAVAIGLLAVAAAGGQAVLEVPAKIADARKLLDTMQGPALRCTVIPIPPRLNLSLRLQAGYFVRLPESHLRGPAQWVVLVRVTPLDGSREPVYLSDVVQTVVGGSAEGPILRGSFLVGEGRYAVKFLVFDGSGELRREEWRIDARLSGNGRKVSAELPPGAVKATSWVPASKGGTGRLTLVLNAAPAGQGVMLGDGDKNRLLDLLFAAMEQLPARSVRLVVVFLPQQREIFRRDPFTTAALQDVDRALSGLRESLVDVRVLQNPDGALDLIEKLAMQERQAAGPADAVIFLGPKSLFSGKPSRDAFGPPAGRAPRFFYLLSGHPTGWGIGAGGVVASGSGGVAGSGGAGSGRGGIGVQNPDASGSANPTLVPYRQAHNFGPDTIESVVGLLGGKTLEATTPNQLADALAAVKGALK